ncbi:Glycosylphosphatidylinositol anchor biosynthesis protein 11 [Taphrina deformans PYCC 5710]|uniref:Glycosylphosphatidylinositol anchor biosynthesis protein 11 n=1 Tax=Taphrina deformans (strain PYCC 5710 / ATCC 11124 / CBS 356.35 / IMI 108563 / JCM 9778 / NBRC 8474) TaxID=1097556 RepID=R4XFJ7_TAPDE|nr:Glycosylphosphatidylinositol anchor biosynthesis protein 11 [Taphrina deformans PYCC 5710]|eukprot:CCG82107.1 Glycosylphosphatidylinositol anchor biosynthesis protein 11 [Taphrina deformans PYCC 5710]
MSRHAQASSSAMKVLDTVAIYGPLAVSSWYFEALVDDPITTLLRLSPAVLLLTIIPRLIDPKCSGATMVYSLGTLLALFLPATYVMVVLMGAPFTTHFPQTALFSAHLSIMLFFTAITKFGLDRQKWLPLLPNIDSEGDSKGDGPKSAGVGARLGGTGMEGIVWGTLAGAYLGAVPIPLDWDRAWQKWPVTVHIGACLGLAVGGTLQTAYNTFSSDTPKARKVTAKDKKVQ